MQNLANAVLDYYLFLYFAEAGMLDSERSVKLVELFNQIENEFSDEEKQELKDAAARRIQQQQDVIETGHIPHYLVSSDEISFLYDVAKGYFDIPFLDEIRDPDDDLSLAEE